MAGFKKAGASFKKGYAKKRAGSDDEDDAPRASKKSKGEDSGEPFVPKLEKDDEKNQFVAVGSQLLHCTTRLLIVEQLNASGKRRVTVSSFKGNTLVSIREYYTTDAGELKPGKKVRNLKSSN